MTLRRFLLMSLAVLPVVATLSVAPAWAAETPIPTKAQTHDFTAKEVESLQIGLAKSGHEIAIDGIWGKQTTEALRAFQKEQGLKVTGFVNSETVKALSKVD